MTGDNNQMSQTLYLNTIIIRFMGIKIWFPLSVAVSKSRDHIETHYNELKTIYFYIKLKIK